MRSLRRLLVLTAMATAMISPAAADPVEINPFGDLTMAILAEPAGTTPGRARLVVTTANGSITSSGQRVYFGLRLMGTEGVEMTGFTLTGTTTGCTVSDFAGRNTAGRWQGAEAFGTQAPMLGSLNSHMRMIGGSIRKSCGNIQIEITFRARPLIVFYGAFFGLNPAPWHSNYDEAPWSTIPTGGNASYEEWWDLWGTFDTLGYSNACTNVSGNAVTCG